ITPEMMEGLRRDIILVIQRYLEIDVEHIELDLETEKNSVALVANIPVRTVRRSSDAARKRGIND
nr:cell division topological specificity factor MinE [Synergistaceae bacterium]